MAAVEGLTAAADDKGLLLLLQLLLRSLTETSDEPAAAAEREVLAAWSSNFGVGAAAQCCCCWRCELLDELRTEALLLVTLVADSAAAAGVGATVGGFPFMSLKDGSTAAG